MNFYMIVGAVAFAVFLYFLVGRRKRPAYGPVLVLQKFNVDEAAPDGLFIDIQGRASGLIAWVLTKIGLIPETTLRVTATELHFQSASLWGQTHEVIPLSRISKSYGGFTKPFGALLLGLLALGGGVLALPFLVIGDSGTRMAALVCLLLAIIVSGICLLIYWLRKRFTIAVETFGCGGTMVGLVFQRSVIEGVPIDLERTLEAVGLLHQKVIESQRAAVTP